MCSLEARGPGDCEADVRDHSAAASLVDDFVVEFVEPDGAVRKESLTRCWNTSFEGVLPVRQFSSHRGRRGFPGLWWWATTEQHVGFESWLERDHVMAYDFDRRVVGLASQPFWLSWRDTSGRARRHAPDYFARLADGSGLVVDVRAADRIAPAGAEAFAVTARACQSVGWRFRQVGTVDPVLTANLRWLAGYRHPRCMNAPIAEGLCRVFAGSAALMRGVHDVGEPIVVLPVLYHLLWSGILTADLERTSLHAAVPICTAAVS